MNHTYYTSIILSVLTKPKYSPVVIFIKKYKTYHYYLFQKLYGLCSIVNIIIRLNIEI